MTVPSSPSTVWSMRVGISALIIYAGSLGALRAELLPAPAAFVLIGALLCWLVALRLRTWRSAVPRLSDVVLGVILALGCILLTSAFPLRVDPASFAHVEAAWLAVSLIPAAVIEELIMRGHLLFPLSARSSVAATVTTSALFGLLHFQYGVGGMLYFFVVGALFAVTALRRGGVATTVVAHVTLNTIAMFALLYSAR